MLYIGTFGSFIGYSFALPLVIKNTFPSFLAQHPFIATYLAGLGFVGALVGSLARPGGGWLSDRLGGSRVTLWCFGGMALATAAAIDGVRQHSFALFFAVLHGRLPVSGAGNGATYRMIPAIFSNLASTRGLTAARVQAPGGGRDRDRRGDRRVRRLPDPARAAPGEPPGRPAITHAQKTIPDKAALHAAVGKLANAHATWSVPALWVFLGGYVALGP